MAWHASVCCPECVVQSADGRSMVGWSGTLMPMNPEKPVRSDVWRKLENDGSLDR
jgi:hypothetical protein